MTKNYLKDKGDWWSGTTADGRSGDFPCVFVEPLDSRQKLPDIVCVAFQEIVDLTADNIAKAPTKNLDVWGELIQEALDKSDEKVYFLVNNSQYSAQNISLQLYEPP